MKFVSQQMGLCVFRAQLRLRTFYLGVKDMKRILALLLAITMLLSLAACGGSEPTPTAAPTEATQLPTQEATEPEPQLNETLQQVYDLGIADMDLLLRAEEVCTRAEAADMLAQVYEIRNGEKSLYLNDMASAFDEDYLSKSATRYYFAQDIYYSAMEDYFDAEYVDWLTWIEYCDSKEWGGTWPDASMIGIKNDGNVGEGGLWDFCSDMDKVSEPPSDHPEALYPVEYGNFFAANYALCAYDRRDGRKIMELDENSNFRPHETMTIAQAAEAALRYYHYFEDEAEMVTYADTYTFDTSIITPELLAKETTLPDASCEKLPSQWHGTLMFDMGRVVAGALAFNPDSRIYEYEIQAVKDAGFNFIGLAVDFSRLQGPVPEEGKLNETRLKDLDQVIAWCMERDIHVDIRCSGAGGMRMDTPFEDWVQWNHDAPNGTDYAEEFAALWKALAQRYADIPNCYLSFNLMIEPEVNSEAQYAAFFGPAVNAIREADADRCIIADIHSGGLTGESMAEMGVALSYHCYDPREFCVVSQYDPEYLNAVTWPYTASDGKTYDAEAVLNAPLDSFYNVSANALAATAEEYGVGFMIGEFGIFDDFSGLPSNRYSDETFAAYYKDMVDTMAEKGYGWCNGVWHGSQGIVASYPAVTNTTYQRINNYPFYIDQTMFALFQQLNGVK